MLLTPKVLKHTAAVYKKHNGDLLKVEAELGLKESALRSRLREIFTKGLAEPIHGFSAPRKEKQYTATEKKWAEDLLALWADKHHNTSQLSRDLNRPRATVREDVERAMRITGTSKAALTPVEVPKGFAFKKTTVQYNAQGDLVMEWRRLSSEVEMLETVASELCKMVDAKSPKLPRPVKTIQSDIMLEVPLFDVHFGKYAWSGETGPGQDFDLKICEELTVGTVSKMIAEAGDFGCALLVIGGDFLHADTRHGTTERGGNPLDVDSRQFKVWSVAMRAIHTCVTMLSAMGATVKIAVINGNHDFESMTHLMRLLAAYYRNEKHVEVINNPRTRQYVEWGTCLIGLAHGDVMRLKDFSSLMALEMPEAWARTTERTWHLGHLHKSMSDSKHGVLTEHLESLTSADAWHSQMGFVGCPRRVVGFRWSAQWGLKSRIYIPVAEVQAGA